MQIILQEDVEKLGTRGQVVDVAEGYARNFLLPRKLALEASSGNMKRLEKMRATFAKKEATEKGDAQKLAELLAGVALELTR
ncbi:MAG TPA: 50S ribosomal protein L9, partial [Candidatus Acidoferrales bacterium]